VVSGPRISLKALHRRHLLLLPLGTLLIGTRFAALEWFRSAA